LSGLAQCVKQGDPWPPSLPAFLALCKPAKRENAGMYRVSPPMLEHKLTDEQKETARERIAAMKRGLVGGA